MKRKASGLSGGNRAVGYVRVSDAMQVDNFSLDAQRAEIGRYCVQRGFELVRIYADEGVSAHGDRIDHRPGVAKLLEDARTGAFDVVVVPMLDRWARNVGVQREALQRLGAAGVGFVSITEKVDFTTPAGKLTLTMLGGVSEFFSDQLAVHVAQGQRERVAQGLSVGPVPFGFVRGEPGTAPTLHAAEAPAVRAAFEARAAGASNGAIAATLNGEGFRTRNGLLFNGHSVKDMLNCRWYIGYVAYRDEEFIGKHEAIVPLSLFERVQARRRSRTAPARLRGEEAWALRGLLFCAACGRPVHGERHASGPYYRERHSWPCDTVGKAVSATRIDAEIGEWFSRIRLDRRWRERIAKGATAGDGTKGIDGLREQQRRLARAYADGAFEEAEYGARKAHIDASIEAVQPDRIPQLEVVADLLAHTKKLWAKATPGERRQLLAPLVDRVTVCLATKHVVEIVPAPVFQQLLPARMREKATTVHSSQGVIGSPLTRRRN